MITDALGMTWKCNSDSFVKCKLARKPFTPTTSCVTEPLQLVHSDICSPLKTAIKGGRYMQLFIDDAMTHTDKYILKYKSEELGKLKEWKALRERESDKQVKQCRTDEVIEYMSQKFAEYLQSEEICKEMTTTYTPQSDRSSNERTAQSWRVYNSC